MWIWCVSVVMLIFSVVIGAIAVVMAVGYAVKKIKSDEVIYSITPTFFKKSSADSLSSSVSSKGTVISLHCSVK